jgi:hypothetical protein
MTTLTICWMGVSIKRCFKESLNPYTPRGYTRQKIPRYCKQDRKVRRTPDFSQFFCPAVTKIDAVRICVWESHKQPSDQI